MMAVDLATGKPKWQTRNPGGWGMTHCSVAKMSFAGVEQYVYCHTKGVVGVAADDGRLLWNFPDWVVRPANLASPLPISGGRIFLAGGYNTGAMMIRLSGEAENIQVEELFRLEPKVFGAEQQTPILFAGHIYGVIPGGRLACLDLEGRQLWQTDRTVNFDLGAYMMVGDELAVIEGPTGSLHRYRATPRGPQPVGRPVQVIDGREIWAPPALAAGRLLVRNQNRLICLDVS